jgi:hypothetical protein
VDSLVEGLIEGDSLTLGEILTEGLILAEALPLGLILLLSETLGLNETETLLEGDKLTLSEVEGEREALTDELCHSKIISSTSKTGLGLGLAEGDILLLADDEEEALGDMLSLPEKPIEGDDEALPEKLALDEGLSEFETLILGLKELDALEEPKDKGPIAPPSLLITNSSR